jgi:hypothetical protein
MKTSVGQITLIDLIGQVERKEVVINHDYQREAGVWPDSARSYFIDTILEGYPFPKIFFYQVFNEKTKRPQKEIVDGQQRITTIIDFFNNKFKLTSASKKHQGKIYNDLGEDERESFVSYQIEYSNMLSATKSELFEMFRRINAYTAPLNAAEKRHAMYQGEFKWFVVEQAALYNPVLEESGIISAKQLARMGDSEFIADLVIAIEIGIVEKNAKNFEKIYKSHEESFKDQNNSRKYLKEFFVFLIRDMAPLHETFLMKSYVIHSLFCAYIHVKYGIPNGENVTGIKPNKTIKFNIDYILSQLSKLVEAHEAQDETGRYAEYVKSCLSSTTKLAQRNKRVSILAKILAKS